MSADTQVEIFGQTEIVPVVPDSLAAETEVFIPVQEVRVVDPADTAEAEIVIYDCGTHAPGYVHEPCQHSLTVVYCCTCAGCMNELWWCGRKPVRESWWRWMVRRHALTYALNALALEVALVVLDVLR
jgi:hypothetical protein